MGKHKAGHPFKYATPEAMQKKIDEYFEACEGHMLCDEQGRPVLDPADKPVYLDRHTPSYKGLAYFLGFNQQQALSRYKRYSDEFEETINRAKLRIENRLEEMLFDPESYNGARYMLIAAYGWSKDPEAEPPAVTVQFIDAQKRNS